MIVLKNKAERICNVRVTEVVVEVKHTCTCRLGCKTATHKPWIASGNEIGAFSVFSIAIVISLTIIQ